MFITHCGQLLTQLRRSTQHGRSRQNFVAWFHLPWGADVQRNLEDGTTEFRADVHLEALIETQLVDRGSDKHKEFLEAIKLDTEERERRRNLRVSVTEAGDVIGDPVKEPPPPQSVEGSAADQVTHYNSDDDSDDDFDPDSDDIFYMKISPQAVPYFVNQTMMATMSIGADLKELVRLLREIFAKLHRLS